MKIDKKGEKIVLEIKYHFYNWLGKLIQYGIPIFFISLKYDLIKPKSTDSGTTLTGWGLIVLLILLSFSRKTFTESLEHYNKNLSETGKRSRVGHIFMILALILILANSFIYAFVELFVIVAIANYLSLISYAPYDMQEVKRKRLQEIFSKKKDELDIDVLNNLYNQKYNPTTNTKTTP